MKQISYVCNRCRLPIKGDVYRLYAGIVDQETDELSDETFYLEQTGEVELCGICLAHIDAGIKKMLKQAPKSASDAKSEKKEFDIQKAIYLRKEGHSLAEIGKELGCCQQTVLNQLNKYANRKGGE